MRHTTPLVVSALTQSGERRYYTHDGGFVALVVEEACPVFDSHSAITLCIDGHDAIVYEIEYLSAAIAREDQEYAAQLADLRG